MMISIESVIPKIPVWQGKKVKIHDLSGGLTNHNYRVVVDGTSYVVRIPGTGSELLAINRENEYRNTLAASKSGVGPQVIYRLEIEESVMVLEFIQGHRELLLALIPALDQGLLDPQHLLGADFR